MDIFVHIDINMYTFCVFLYIWVSICIRNQYLQALNVSQSLQNTTFLLSLNANDSHYLLKFHAKKGLFDIFNDLGQLPLTLERHT